MKKNILFLVGLAFSCSVFAKATSADRATLFMISDVIKACPIEFTKSLEKEEDILGITSELSRNDQDLSVMTLVMTTGYAGTPMNPGDMIQNKITVVKTAKTVQPLDGWLEDITCTIAP